MISHSFTKSVNNFLKNLKEESAIKLQNHFYMLEKEFDKAINKTNWYVKGTRTRTLWTPIGDIKITRKIYRNNHTGKYKILFDEHIGLEPYTYIQKNFFPFIMNCVTKVYSYEKLSKMLGHEISKWSITKIMKQGKLYFKPKQLTKKVETLFVNVDGMFINKWRDKRYEVKFALAYTGTKQKGNRHILLNKTLLPFAKNISRSDMANILFDYLSKIYGEYQEIVFIGDGASWITALAKEFRDSTRYIDQFHYMKFIKDFLPHGIKINREGIMKWNTKELEEWLFLVVSNDGELKLSSNQTRLLPKIKKYHQSYITCKSKGYKNAIEAIQSHQIASILKNRRAFSTKVATKIMMINCADYNNWELTVNQHEGISLEKVYDYNPNIWDFDSHSHSNVPGFENSRSGLAFFRNIINNSN